MDMPKEPCHLCGVEHELSEGLCLPCKWAEAHESKLFLSPGIDDSDQQSPLQI